MKLPRSAARRLGGLTLPVVIGLLYVGLVRLIVLPAWAQATATGDPGFLRWRLDGGSLERPLLAANLLLIGFLATAYFGRRADRRATVADTIGTFGTALLVAYLSIGLV